MQVAALASPPLAIALLAIALSGDFARQTAPALFAQMIASLTLAYLSSVAGDGVGVVVATSGGLLACAGLTAVVLVVDSRLAAKGIANAEATAIRPWLGIRRARRWRRFEHHFWASVAAHTWARSQTRQALGQAEQDRSRASQLRCSERLYSLERDGRLALFVFVRSDDLGRLLEAAAYDPEDYF